MDLPFIPMIEEISDFPNYRGPFCKFNSKIIWHRRTDVQPTSHRLPALRKIGITFNRIPYVADGRDPKTVEQGCRKRILQNLLHDKNGRLTFRHIGRLKKFARGIVRKHFKQIDPTDPRIEFEKYLDGCKNYSAARKDQLRKSLKDWKETQYVHKDEPFHKFNLRTIKGFIKRETYTEVKAARLINSPVDPHKCLISPYTKLIEEQAYDLQTFNRITFIKHVPVLDRPKVLDAMPGDQFLSSDWSSFECHFTAEIMGAIEQELFRYCTALCGPSVYSLYKYSTQIRKVAMKHFNYQVPATRMSGESFTSLGNGFANMVLMQFLIEELKGSRILRGFVEGDDGIFSIAGEVPDAEFFSQFGFAVKLSQSKEPGHAAFCGNLYHKGTYENLACPIKKLTSAGWTFNNVMYTNDVTKLKQEFRAKGMSMAYLLHGCPIMSSYALKTLELTQDVTPRWSCLSDHEREQLKDVIATGVLPDWINDKMRRGPTDGSRELFAQEFGVSVNTQILAEEALSKVKDVFTTLSDPIFNQVLKIDQSQTLFKERYHKSVINGYNYVCYSI
jgi:hypothetical protein